MLPSVASAASVAFNTSAAPAAAAAFDASAASAASDARATAAATAAALLPHGSGVALGWCWIRGALDRGHEAGAMNKGRGLGERWAGLLRLIDFC